MGGKGVVRRYYGRGEGRSNYQCITEYLRVLCLKPIGNFCTGCFCELFLFSGVRLRGGLKLWQ